MGTNFYINGQEWLDGVRDDPTVHIGKRSAAGLYCFDCGVTLCKDGTRGVHLGRSEWHDKCPKCGKSRTPEELDRSSAGVELGFNNNPTEEKTGVRSCSSFNWAMNRETELFKRVRKQGMKLNDPCIVDEYGRKYTAHEFIDLLDACPLQFGDSIGSWFS